MSSNITTRFSGDSMGARTKLNVSYVNGCLVLAAIVGLLFQSWVVFLVVAAILVAGDLYIGSIRPSGQRRMPLE
jgi:hypothetical protein